VLGVKLLHIAPPLLLALFACGPGNEEAPPPRPATSAAPPTPVAALPGADDPVPTLRLPSDVHPLAESIELYVDPKQDRYTGTVDIAVALDQPRALVWLHGKALHVTAASVVPDGAAPIPGTWQERHESGVAALVLASAVPAGKARLHVEFDAAFGNGQKGLYKASEAGDSYAFTQFEAIAAREAFPCFDDPGFKIPFTTTLLVPLDAKAVANTHEVSRAPENGSMRVAFAPTQPLPSYLVAFAVGPLDIVPAPDVPPDGVRTRPLPLRGVSVRGRGKEMGYALGHAGEILSTLEKYTGIEYPYDKLDIIAVPGKGGAMENPGAVTFREAALLFDATTATVGQRRGYAGVMAHELAHQWTGDLVTMQWWDDTWLNEAFATWLGNKTVDAWDPKMHAGMTLLRGVQGAMSTDALVNARAIRQPIASTHDIENAFDTITYQKGGGVLSMFERWAGAEAWQKGLHAYLDKHRFGSATADDFLDAENAATGKDVKTAFHTFLDQPGLPFVEVSLACGDAPKRKPESKAGTAVPPTVHFKQSRYLPLGSTGDSARTWKIPICVRTATTEKCTLLTQAEGDLVLADSNSPPVGHVDCPDWVFPNADADGYYRFALAPDDLAKLRKHLDGLTTREKVAYATSVRAGYSRGTTLYADALAAVTPLVAEHDPAAAEEPMAYVGQARDWLSADPLRAKVEGYGRTLYAPLARKLGWEAKKDDDDETRQLRGSVIGFLAMTARDPQVRAEAKKRGLAYMGVGKDAKIHIDAVDPNLVSTCLSVVGEDADRATWDAMKALFTQSVDEALRGRLLWAMGLAKDATLSASARELVLDPSLRDNETLTPLWAQLGAFETRETAWGWLKDHYDAVRARLPKHHGGVALVGAPHPFCDEAHAADAQAFFGPKVDGIDGGPRALASTLEDIHLCVAKRAAQEASARALFARGR
jgi:alanyl aminopeptidase